MSKIIYLYKRGRFHDEKWHHIRLEAYHEYDTFYHYQGNFGKGYSLIDRLNIHIHKDPKQFECIGFKVDSGKDLAEGLCAKSFKDFRAEKMEGDRDWDSFQQIQRHQYERLRAYVMRIILETSLVDFSTVINPEGKVTTFT